MRSKRRKKDNMLLTLQFHSAIKLYDLFFCWLETKAHNVTDKIAIIKLLVVLTVATIYIQEDLDSWLFTPFLGS